MFLFMRSRFDPRGVGSKFQNSEEARESERVRKLLVRFFFFFLMTMSKKRKRKVKKIETYGESLGPGMIKWKPAFATPYSLRIETVPPIQEGYDCVRGLGYVLLNSRGGQDTHS